MKSNIKPRKGRHKISLSALAQRWNMCPFRAFIYNWRFTHGFILCLACGALALQGCHQLWQLFVSWDSPDANGASDFWNLANRIVSCTVNTRSKKQMNSSDYVVHSMNQIVVLTTPKNIVLEKIAISDSPIQAAVIALLSVCSRPQKTIKCSPSNKICIICFLRFIAKNAEK